jgi:hypothetical protein
MPGIEVRAAREPSVTAPSSHRGARMGEWLGTCSLKRCMRGKERIRRKHLEQWGWTVLDETREAGRTRRLVLRNPAGAQVTVEASTRPRAYWQAEVIAAAMRRRGSDRTGRTEEDRARQTSGG